MLSTQTSNGPTPEASLLLLKQLRVLGLGMSPESLAKYGILDGERVGLAHVSMMGPSGDQVWLKPRTLMERDYANGYGAGETATHYSLLGPKPLVLCQSLVDALTLGELLEEYNMGDLFSIAASTGWGAVPKEWQNGLWWRLWSDVYVVGSIDYAERIQNLAAKDVYFLEPKNRPRLAQEGEVDQTVRDWFDSARLFSHRGGPAATASTEATVKMVPLKLVDINGTFEDGFLYYPCKALEILTVPTVTPEGEVVMLTAKTKVTRVVKSNRSLQEVISVLARPGASLGARVLSLTDGTLIAKAPAPSARGTWSFDSIAAYVAGTAPVRLLGELLEIIRTIMQSSIWLPYPEDYYVLALIVVTTYVQPIFEAVPLVLASGPWGTGKSELGKLMARLCANGYVIGDVTPATTARDIDKNRGFVVFDDLEEIGKKAKKGSVACSDFMQMLKVSYKKETAIKVVTNPKTMDTEILNFFGVKMFTNILGIEDVLGSRTLLITTAKKPSHYTRIHHGVNTAQLRNDLHVWSCENAAAVDAAYQALPIVGSREEEITAPLRVLAQMSGIKAYEEMLDLHLGKVAAAPPTIDLEAIFQAVVDGMIAKNASKVSAAQVMAEMEEQLCALKVARPPALKLVWVGWKLRKFGYVSREEKEGERVVINDVSHRFYTLLRPKLVVPPALPLEIAEDIAEPDFDGPGI